MIELVVVEILPFEFESQLFAVKSVRKGLKIPQQSRALITRAHRGGGGGGGGSAYAGGCHKVKCANEKKRK